MKCIFCEEELSPETKPEHILLSCLGGGGRKTTRSVDCSKHNEQFGSTIDKKMAEQVRVIRNVLQLESGTGNPPPGLKNVKAGGQTINFDNKGVPSCVGVKPFSVTKLPDGNVEIAINASPEKLRSLIPNIAAVAGLSEQKIAEMLQEGNAAIISQRPGEVHHQLSFGGDDALRSVVKSALVLWTLAVGNEEVRSEIYSEARNFVLLGSDFNGIRWQTPQNGT